MCLVLSDLTLLGRYSMSAQRALSKNYGKISPLFTPVSAAVIYKVSYTLTDFLPQLYPEYPPACYIRRRTFSTPPEAGPSSFWRTFRPKFGGRSHPTGGHKGTSRPRTDPTGGHNGHVGRSAYRLRSSSATIAVAASVWASLKTL